MDNLSIFKPGRNCWRVEKATYAALVVDCANYYRNLHESISKAKHSIFITGWDIDSRVELLRAETLKDPDAPKNLHELLTWKAQENPDLKIYLNRWDYTLFMANIREPMGVFRWRGELLPNIYFCRDDMVPFGGCHHQKVIVIDDEVAYTGGMDVALQRWDGRQHFPEHEARVDPGGAYNPHAENHYGPYHDIMTVVTGPAARALGEQVRRRWKIATGYDPVPLRKQETPGIPHVWPDTDPPDFEDINVAITRTIPPLEGIKKEYHIERMLINEIGQAEHVIYMENQYFTRETIARAINQQMQSKPGLKVILVSSYNPQGVAERKAMWMNRIKFYDILKSNGMEDRVVMAYPASEVNGTMATVRIHSKFMIVDDKFMHVGSANINNRSMRLDTECDLVYAATTEAHAKKIAAIRNDLLKEHTGREPEATERILYQSPSVHDILLKVPESRQFLKEVSDEDFLDETLKEFTTLIADPEGELLSKITVMPRRHADFRRFPLQRITFGIVVIGIIAALFSLWNYTPLGELAQPDKVAALIDHIREAPGTIPMAIGLYVIGIMLFFPAAVMTAGMAIAFGPVTGFIVSMLGGTLGTLAGIFLGRVIRAEYFGVMMRSAIEKVRQHTKDASLAAVTFLRMLPVAPFSAVNIAFGIVRVPLPSAIGGTILGLLPGTAVLCFMGDSLARVWENRDLSSYLMVGAGIALWIGIIFASQFLYRLWRDRHREYKAA
jgi:phospholipase D1/2